MKNFGMWCRSVGSSRSLTVPSRCTTWVWSMSSVVVVTTTQRPLDGVAIITGTVAPARTVS